MAEREAHVVGSPTGAMPAAGVRTALKILGRRLRSLPAGREGYPAFLEAITAADRSDVAFQHTVTSGLSRAVSSLGPIGALRSRRFTEPIVEEIRAVTALAGPDTVFEVEMPGELMLVARVPPQVRPAMANALARPAIGLAAASAPGTRFAVHLCPTGKGSGALDGLGDVAPIVLLANAIVAGWPPGRRLDLVHAPFAVRGRVGRTERWFYRPLVNLRLPPGTRFAAGFADESPPMSDQQSVLRILEDHLGRQVVVSTPCALGWDEPDAGRPGLERMAHLCAA